jgi:hypothetical protein
MCWVLARILIRAAHASKICFMSAILSQGPMIYISMLEIGFHQRVSASLVLADIGDTA